MNINEDGQLEGEVSQEEEVGAADTVEEANGTEAEPEGGDMVGDDKSNIA